MSLLHRCMALGVVGFFMMANAEAMQVAQSKQSISERQKQFMRENQKRQQEEMIRQQQKMHQEFQQIQSKKADQPKAMGQNISPQMKQMEPQKKVRKKAKF